MIDKALQKDMEKQLTGEDAGEELFAHRTSVRLTPENATFFASAGGLISLRFRGEAGEEVFERVVILRSFPVTDPDIFLSVREPDVRNRERGQEIGIINHIADFDADTQALLRAELDLRYFTPVISKVYSVKEKLGYCYWEVDTSAGRFSLVLNNPSNNVRKLEDGRVRISDIDGNCFEIPDPEALDRASLRKIEIYL